jgi:hypothetical protein
MARLLPLDNLYLRRIDRLVEIVGPARYLGWGRAAGGEFFVDVLPEGGDPETARWPDVDRHIGTTLHAAIGSALRAAQGARP